MHCLTQTWEDVGVVGATHVLVFPVHGENGEAVLWRRSNWREIWRMLKNPFRRPRRAWMQPSSKWSAALPCRVVCDTTGRWKSIELWETDSRCWQLFVSWSGGRADKFPVKDPVGRYYLAHAGTAFDPHRHDNILPVNLLALPDGMWGAAPMQASLDCFHVDKLIPCNHLWVEMENGTRHLLEAVHSSHRAPREDVMVVLDAMPVACVIQAPFLTPVPVISGGGDNDMDATYARPAPEMPGVTDPCDIDEGRYDQDDVEPVMTPADDTPVVSLRYVPGMDD